MPLNNGSSPRLEEAIQFLAGPDFIPAQSSPAQLEFKDSVRFSFPTPRPSDYTENNTVYGQLCRCAEDWQKCPAIILLHGWNSGLSYRYRFPWIARRCNRAGFNAAMFELPYHFQRRPRPPGACSGVNYLRVAERTAQALAEICALTGWLLREGCPAVALWGSSYGGWLAGLSACHDARLKAVVMAVPGVRSNRSRAERVVWRRVREAMLREDKAMALLNQTLLNLTLNRPAVARENILLIEAVYDLLASREPIEELWNVWGKPEIWRLPHGHFSFSLIGAPLLLANRVLGWLEARVG